MNSLYSLLGIFSNVIFVTAYEVCQDYGTIYTYCNDGQHCCEDDTSCCDDGLSDGVIWGIVIGAIILKICIIACCVQAYRRRRARIIVQQNGRPVNNVAYAQPYVVGQNGYGAAAAAAAPPYTSKSYAPPSYPGNAPPAYSEAVAQ